MSSTATFASPAFSGNDLVWQDAAPLAHDHSCPCWGISLELVAELAGFEHCLGAAEVVPERVLVAA
jgi:hypothetical protein